MIACCGCNCGSTESLIRQFLKSQGYTDWLTIPVAIGKEKSLRLLERLPNDPMVPPLADYIKKRGRYAVLIGYDEDALRWVDLVGGVKASIEAECLVERFA